jgi:hypothetical protein
MENVYLYQLFETGEHITKIFVLANRDKNIAIEVMDKMVVKAIKRKLSFKYHIEIYNLTENKWEKTIIRSNKEKLNDLFIKNEY